MIAQTPQGRFGSLEANRTDPINSLILHKGIKQRLLNLYNDHLNPITKRRR
jgi:hypothetical protein